jgi:two-component system NtrC family sensor kinase
LKNRITVERDFARVPDISCYPNQLNQVILNLLVNAAHAIEGKGIITVRTRVEQASIILEVSDTGQGIPEDIRDRIFEPGFTTKGKGKGTGLGLSIARKIMEEHGGSIDFTTETGRGTTFRLTLPVT